ncbi:MAG: hypothetical protein KGI89_14815 [Euryarchaeota archaeon]|nr:hypothetical protein [Euryarchaeota archaeon]
MVTAPRVGAWRQGSPRRSSLAVQLLVIGVLWVVLLPPVPANAPPLPAQLEPRSSHSGLSSSTPSSSDCGRVGALSGCPSHTLTSVSGSAWYLSQAPYPWPSSNWGMTADFDERFHAFVEFGGFGTGFLGLNQTWVYANETWSKFTNGAEPPGAVFPSMAYDPTCNAPWGGKGCTILFGGCTELSCSYPQATTWLLSPLGWTNVTSSSVLTPPARGMTSMIYDAEAGGDLLFGGRGAGGRALNDSWLWKNGQWQNLTAGLSTAPSPRSSASMAYDPTARAAILFGGESSTFGACGFACADTWSFSSGKWHNLTQPSGPEGRFNAAMATDPMDQGVVLFGGDEAVPGTAGALLSNNSWVYDGTWRNVSGTLGASPPMQEYPVAALDNSTSYVILFDGCASLGGGRNGCGHSNQVWTYPLPEVVLTGPWLSTSAIGLGQSVQVGASALQGTAGLPISWSGLPPGCSEVGFGIENFSCTPSSPGTYPLSFQVSVNLGAAGWMNLSSRTSILTVQDLLAVSAPTAYPNPVTVGYLLRLSALASGGLFPVSLHWYGLPAGCVSPVGGLGFEEFLNCTPVVVGDYIVWANATDAYGVSAVAASLAIIVQNVPLVVGAPWAVPNPVNVGSFLELSVAVSGGVRPYYVLWHGLPSGCASSPNGTAQGASLNCTPVGTGDYAVDVTARDPAGQVSTSSTLFVNVISTPLSVNAPQAYPDPATVGSPLALSASSTGGTYPIYYRWYGVPSGCSQLTNTSWNGQFMNCTPNAAGTFSVSFEAQDNLGRSAYSVTLRLQVQARPPPPPGPVQPGGGLDLAVALSLGIGGSLAPLLGWAVLLRRNRDPRERPPPFPPPAPGPSVAWRPEP